MKLTVESVVGVSIVVLFAASFVPGVPGQAYLFMVAFVLTFVLLFLQRRWESRAVAAFRSRAVTADPSITQPLQNTGSGPLTWSRSEPKLGIPEFQLIENSIPVATLWLEPQGRFVEAQTKEGRWIGSYEDSRLRICLPPPHTGVAVLHGGWRYRLECPDARVFRIRSSAVVVSVPMLTFAPRLGNKVVEDDAGNQIIRFDGSRRYCYIEPVAGSLPDLTLVVLMSVYVMIYETVFNTAD